MENYTIIFMHSLNMGSWAHTDWVSLNGIKTGNIPPNPRRLSGREWVGILLCPYVMHHFQMARSSCPMWPTLAFSPMYLFYPQYYWAQCKLCGFYQIALFCGGFINGNDFILIHAYYIPLIKKRVIALTILLDYTNLCTIPA